MGPGQAQAPARIDVVASASPIRRQWTYSPVKLAGYTSAVNTPVTAQAKTEMVQYQGSFAPSKEVNKTERKTNTMWKSIDW